MIAVTNFRSQQSPPVKEVRHRTVQYGSSIIVLILAASLNQLIIIVNKPLLQYGTLFLIAISTSLQVKPALAQESSYYALRCEYLRSEEQTSELQSLMRTSYAVFC